MIELVIRHLALFMIICIVGYNRYLIQKNMEEIEKLRKIVRKHHD